MLFLTHLLIGVLLARGRLPTLCVVFGAALPDLIDKPLGMAGVFPMYHTVAHSALFGVVFVALSLGARLTDRPAAAGAVVATAVGWASHLAADALHIIINGRPENTVFLVWPVVSTWDSIDAGPGSFFLQYVGTTSFYLEVVVWLCGGYLLLRARRSDPGPDPDGSGPA